MDDDDRVDATSPVIFPVSPFSGAGLVGEDRPELILPLRRGPDGRLGVPDDT